MKSIKMWCAGEERRCIRHLHRIPGRLVFLLLAAAELEIELPLVRIILGARLLK